MPRTANRRPAPAARRFHLVPSLLAASLGLVLSVPLQAAADAAPAASPAIAADAQPVWITLGDPAFQLLQQLQPGLRSDTVRRWMVQAPVARGRGAELRDEAETVHLVQVDESVLPALSQAIHEQRHHCAGFVAHASRAEALRALDEHEAALRAQPGLAAIAPSYTIDDQALVTPMINQVQDSQILATIQTLSDFQNRYYTTTPGVQASTAIMNMWKTLAGSRSDVTVQQFTHPNWPQKSVILTIQGSTAPQEIVVMGAHMDSIAGGRMSDTTRAPGADDDGSGVATLTEVLRVMMASNYKPNRTIQLMAYAAEEVGLRGSTEIARQYKRQRKKVVGVLQLDMTNYKGSPQDIFIYTDYTNAAQNTFVANLAATYLPTLAVGYDKCGYGCSDHASWNNRGFAASFPFEAAFGDDDPYIHTANDTLANMGNQALHAAKFAKLALAYAVELGSDAPAR